MYLRCIKHKACVPLRNSKEGEPTKRCMIILLIIDYPFMLIAELLPIPFELVFLSCFIIRLIFITRNAQCSKATMIGLN
jgi:hypothetical protein